ncbi:MAG: hypothetical protein M3083_07150 [Actinomycetota bacterium]|nr:hypothetical protein [Actinomycetota bacterium]
MANAESVGDLLGDLRRNEVEGVEIMWAPDPGSLSPSGLADAWLYPNTDFGEGRGFLPHPVLRAVVPVGPPFLPVTFAAIIDTGGPITVISPAFADAAGSSATDMGEQTVLRLSGR